MNNKIVKSIYCLLLCDASGLTAATIKPITPRKNPTQNQPENAGASYPFDLIIAILMLPKIKPPMIPQCNILSLNYLPYILTSKIIPLQKNNNQHFSHIVEYIGI